MTPTLETIMAFAPCPTYTEARVQQLLDEGFSLETLRSIPVDDALWLLGRLMSDQNRRAFARRCATACLGNWQGEVPQVVRQWLETGDGQLRSAAESAARSAAWSAAESAARSAAESAARSAAWSAAESAARDQQLVWAFELVQAQESA